MTDVIVTCSEHFIDAALNEIRRYHKQLTLVTQLSPQHLHVRHPGAFGAFTTPWKDKLPIYLHHAFPLHHTLPLTGTPGDFVQLRQQAQTLCQDDPIIQVQIAGDYAYSAMSIIHSLRPGQTSHLAALPQNRVLSVLINGQTASLGLSWAAQNLSLFAGGQPSFDEPVPNRAGRKLLEALTAFRIPLQAGAHALDLGAAPGAWTEILRRRGLRVTAVAPRTLYDWLQTDPQVRAFYLTAEEYLGQCDTTYDMLLNDMRLDAQDSARLMVAYAPHLRTNGLALMTLKLRMRQTARVMDHTFRILRKAYRIVCVRQLANNRKEVTLFLRRLA